MKKVSFIFMVLALIIVCAPMQAFADDAEPAEETVIAEEITEDVDVEMTETESVAVEVPESAETPVRPEPTALEKAVSYEYVGRGVFNADFSDLQIPESQSEEFIQALRYAGLIEDGIVCTVENGIIAGIDWAPDEPIEEPVIETPTEAVTEEEAIAEVPEEEPVAESPSRTVVEEEPVAEKPVTEESAAVVETPVDRSTPVVKSAPVAEEPLEASVTLSATEATELTETPAPAEEPAKKGLLAVAFGELAVAVLAALKLIV